MKTNNLVRTFKNARSGGEILSTLKEVYALGYKFYRFYRKGYVHPNKDVLHKQGAVINELPSGFSVYTEQS